MPYPVLPPPPPAVIQSQLPEDIATQNIATATTPSVAEPETLQSSPLVALQRQSRAGALQPTSTPPSAQDLTGFLFQVPPSGSFRLYQRNTDPLSSATTPYTKALEIQLPKPEVAQEPTPTDTSRLLKKSSPPQTQMPPVVLEDVVELTADRQEYDQTRQIITAEGNVVMRVRQSVLSADKVQINLQNRMAVAVGNAAWRRGNQVLRGQRFEYNFVQDVGTIQNATGELYTPTSGTDFTPTLPTDVSATALQERPLSDRVLASQPQENVTETPGGISVEVGSGFGQSGQVRRVRYQAETLDFTPEGGVATNVRFTNDPFSPPELELRAERAEFRRIDPLVDEIRATRPQLVFDQGFRVSVFPRRVVIDRRERDPAVFAIGYDGEDRGGLYVEGRFSPLTRPGFEFKVQPQFYVQRALTGEGSSFGDLFGLKSKLNAVFGPKTTLVGSAVFTSLNLGEVDDNLRASLRLQQLIGTHTLTGEYSFRDRLFNGSLGYQTVQSSIGAVLTSPVFKLGTTGINMSYQAGYQYINADTDRLDLLDVIRENDRASLGRFQAGVALSRPVPLWKGTGLPATPEEGLKYTPSPVIPYLQLVLGLRGITSHYTNDENQSSLTGTVGIIGQIGHFSRPWLDYTGFNLTYTQVFPDGESPFYFDRIADVRVLGAGITQQIYGPFRLGFQTAINLDTGESINTDYILEYSRRTYGIMLRINPVRELAALTFRISDFNWTGGAEPFSGVDDVRSVEGGVRRDYD
jgi:hypothetical protein